MHARRSARVVLLDADQVLPVRSHFRRPVPPVEWAWFVPGGGVEEGESILDAAIRELAEETGVDLAAEDLVHLAFAQGDGQVGDLAGPMRDDIFVAECGRPEPSTANMEAHERSAFGEFRWWPVDHLRATAELVFPTDLAATLAAYRAAPTWFPARLPW